MATTEEQLQKQLSEKDELINSLKEKTKTFVAKLKEDHSNEINLLKQQQQEKVEQAKVIILKLKEESESSKAKAIQDQANLKQLEADLAESKNQASQYLERVEEEKEKSITVISDLTSQLETSKTALSKVSVLEKTIIDLKKQLQQSERESEKDWPMEKQLTELRTLRSTTTNAADVSSSLSLDLPDNTNSSNDAASSVYSPTASPYHSSTTTDAPLLNLSLRPEEIKQLQVALETALTKQKAQENEVLVLTEKVQKIEGQNEELKQKLVLVEKQSQQVLTEKENLYQEKIKVLESEAITQTNQLKSQQSLQQESNDVIVQLKQENDTLRQHYLQSQQLQSQSQSTEVASLTAAIAANTLIIENLNKEKTTLITQNQEVMSVMEALKNEYDSVKSDNLLLKESQEKLKLENKAILNAIETLHQEKLSVSNELIQLQEVVVELKEQNQQQQAQQNELALTTAIPPTTATTNIITTNGEYNQLKQEYEHLKLEYDEMKRIQTEFENEDSQLVSELEVEQFRLENLRSGASNSGNISSSSNSNSSDDISGSGDDKNSSSNGNVDGAMIKDNSSTALAAIVGSDSTSSSNNNNSNNNMDAKLIEMTEQNEMVISKLTQVAQQEMMTLKTDLDKKSSEITGLNNVITGLNTEVDKTSLVITELTLELEKKSNEISGLSVELKNKSAEIFELTTVITGLNTEIEKKSNVITQLTTDVEVKSNKINQLQSEFEDADGLVHLIQEKLGMELTTLRNTCKTAEEEITGLKLELDKKVAEISLLQSEIQQLTSTQQDQNQEKQSIQSQKTQELQQQLQQAQQIQQHEQQILFYTNEITTLKSELDTKSSTITQLSEEINTLQTQLSATQEIKQNIDTEYAHALQLKKEVEKEKDEVVAELKKKEELIAQLQKGKREGEENTSLQLVQTQNRVKELLQECESLQAVIAAKTADTQFLRSSLNASSELASSLQNQIKSLQQDLESTAAQLKSEIDQNQDRKKKLREYVTNLNNEKSQLETTVTALQLELTTLKDQNTELIKSTQHIQQERELMEMKHNKVIEQILLDKDILQHNYEKTEFQLKSEITQLQLIVDTHTKGISEQLQEAYHQVEIANKELESHKTKRLQARNEMVNYAQTLENVTKDSENLKCLIQENITPMVYDQVSNLESLLINIERACNQLSNKRMVRLQTKANDYVLKRFRNSTRIINRSSNNHPLGISTAIGDGLLSESTTDSIMNLHGNSSNNNSNNNNNNNSINSNSSNFTPITMYKKGSSNSTSIGGNYAQQQSVALLAEAIEQAEVLRNELDRVRAGITLVQQSMEKLNEVVQMDTRNCCSTMCDVFSTLPFIAPFLNATSSGGSVTRNRGSRGAYDPLQSPMGNNNITDDDNYSASLLTTSATPNHSRRPNDNSNSNNNNYNSNNNVMTNSSSSRSNSPRREKSVTSPLKSIVQSRQTGMTRITQQQSLQQAPQQMSGSGGGNNNHDVDDSDSNRLEMEGFAEVDL